MKTREQRYELNHRSYEAINQHYGFHEAEAADFRYRSTSLAADNPMSDYYGDLAVQADIYIYEMLRDQATKECAEAMAQRAQPVGQATIYLIQAA